MKKGLVFAFTLTGTFIGAGFATGQEIFTFFITKHPHGYLYYILSLIIMNMTCFFAYIKSKKEETNKINILYRRSLGNILGNMIYAVSLFALFCGYGAAAAGCGALFAERFSLPYFLGACVMCVTSCAIYRSGIKGIYFLNIIITPLIIISTIFLGIISAANTNAVSVFNPAGQYPGGFVPLIFSLLYAGYNIFPLISVSSAEGHSGKKSMIWGFVFNFFITAAAGAAVFGAINAHIDEASGFLLPLPAVFSKISSSASEIYTAVMYGALITTGTSCFFSFVSGFEEYFRLNRIAVYLICVAGTVVFSYTGFANIVRIIYPLIGVGGIFAIYGMTYR